MKKCLKCDKEIDEKWAICFECNAILKKMVQEYNIIEYYNTEKIVKFKLMAQEIKIANQRLKELKENIDNYIPKEIEKCEK
jgi:hypothetical protein